MLAFRPAFFSPFGFPNSKTVKRDLNFLCTETAFLTLGSWTALFLGQKNIALIKEALFKIGSLYIDEEAIGLRLYAIIIHEIGTKNFGNTKFWKFCTFGQIDA